MIIIVTSSKFEFADVHSPQISTYIINRNDGQKYLESLFRATKNTPADVELNKQGRISGSSNHKINERDRFESKWAKIKDNDDNGEVMKDRKDDDHQDDGEAVRRISNCSADSFALLEGYSEGSEASSDQGDCEMDESGGNHLEIGEACNGILLAPAGSPPSVNNIAGNADFDVSKSVGRSESRSQARSSPVSSSSCSDSSDSHEPNSSEPSPGWSNSESVVCKERRAGQQLKANQQSTAYFGSTAHFGGAASSQDNDVRHPGHELNNTDMDQSYQVDENSVKVAAAGSCVYSRQDQVLFHEYYANV